MWVRVHEKKGKKNSVFLQLKDLLGYNSAMNTHDFLGFNYSTVWEKGMGWQPPGNKKNTLLKCN